MRSTQSVIKSNLMKTWLASEGLHAARSMDVTEFVSRLVASKDRRAEGGVRGPAAISAFQYMIIVLP